MEFAIWHKDSSLTSTPEFQGSEGQVVGFWLRNYQGGVSSLDHKIAPANPNRRDELWELSCGRLEDCTPPV